MTEGDDHPNGNELSVLTIIQLSDEEFETKVLNSVRIGEEIVY